MENYYIILNVSRDATDEELRRAFKARCRECHPDFHGEDAATAFHAVSRAFAVLSDPARRAAYDRELFDRERPRRAVVAERVDLVDDFQRHAPNLDDMLEYFFGERPQPAKSGAPRRLSVEVQLDQDEALYGGVLPLSLPLPVNCPECDGAGRIFGLICARCDGRGFVRRRVSVAVPIPPGVRDQALIEYPLDELGLPGTRLDVLVRSPL